MCQACLALARRRSGAFGWPLGDDGEAPRRFAAAAEWAEAPDDDPPADAPAADDPPIDAQRT